MRKLMEYKIISGKVVETRRSWMPVRQAGEPKPTRGTRKAGNSSEKKIRANETESARELARAINCTVQAGDIFCALKYDDGHLPESYEEAAADMRRFLRVLRREFRKVFGRLPWLFWVTANWSPKRQAPARLHQHLVAERDAIALVERLWQGGGLNIELLDGRADHSDLAAYMVANVHGQPAKKKWHASRNVRRPVYTEPVEVDDPEDVQPERGAVIREHQVTLDEDGRVVGSYLRVVLPEPVKVRGGQVVIPGRRRRR
ncbi:MAG: hypothetical protein IK095_05155 [Oscillospiraceae bacterium]|nr:hypothetical protein [Oscillospiraceae bacterium]